MSEMRTFVTPACMSCKITSTIDLPLENYNRLQSGMSVANALGNLNKDIQRLVDSGTHPECWSAMFGGWGNGYKYDEEED